MPGGPMPGGPMPGGEMPGGPMPGGPVPGAPGMAQPLAPGMSPEDLAIAAKGDFENIKFKNDRLNDKMAKGAADLNELKRRVMTELYEALEDAGVDLNDINSVSAFVQQVEQEDPDLMELLDAAFRTIAPEAQGPTAGAPPMPGVPSMPGEMPGGPPGGMAGGPPGGPMPEEPGVAERFRGLRERLG